MRVVREIANGLIENFTASLRWASVQMIAAWGAIWVIYAQLPPDVMVQMANMKFIGINVPTWMGIGQALMTYLARVKVPKAVV
jgi:hypothetical protein